SVPMLIEKKSENLEAIAITSPTIDEDMPSGPLKDWAKMNGKVYEIDPFL
ncbi:unnamed protein product, partial [marine sediment metagenome]